MSMSEPLLPHTSADDEARTAAAEPGPTGPEPEAPEEPDVNDPTEGASTDPAAPEVRESHFVTPTPGQRLHPEDLDE